MTFYIDEGKHDVEIKFGETKLRLFADMISVATLGIMIFLFFSNVRKKFLNIVKQKVKLYNYSK